MPVNLFNLALKTLFSLFFTLVFLPCFSQDTARQNWKDRVDFNLGVGWYKQSSADIQGNPLKAVVPGLLPRRRHNTALRDNWGLAGDDATDNPIWHGAMYVELATRVRITDSISIRASVVGENRTFSEGLYTPATTHVYPKFLVNGRKTVNIFNQSFLFGVDGGYRDTFRMFEGLTMYNNDVDNFEGFAQWKKLRFTHCHIGDLIFDGGFAINDTYTWMLSLEGLTFSEKWKADVRAGVVNNVLYYWGDPLMPTYELSAGVYNDNTRLYAQYSYRGDDAGQVNPHAALTGVRHTRHTKDFYLNGHLEARYYGAGYNMGLVFEEIYFRPRGFNTVASNFYPLMWYNRPYSKWAVFTEYAGYTVVGATAFAQVRKRLINKLWLYAELDANAIKPGDTKWVLLTFYNVSVAYEPVKDTYFTAGLNNKGINLDKHYQDFYAYTKPALHLQLIRTFGW